MDIKDILDKDGMRRSITRISYEIIEKNKGVDNIILIGVKTRGIYIAKRIAELIKQFENIEVQCLELDVINFRDDNPEATRNINTSIDLTDKKVILIDDVLFKGRTVRAAMDAIVQMGRPKEIQLAVLIDRGHREFPIRADYIGKNIPTSINEQIHVKVKEIDDIDNVYLSK